MLDTFPFKLSEGQFDKLMERVDPEGKGYISYHEFLEIFESKEGEVCRVLTCSMRRTPDCIAVCISTQ